MAAYPSEDDSRHHRAWLYADILQGPVTQGPVQAVETPRYPANPASVHKLVLPVDDFAQLDQNEMEPLIVLNNRAVIHVILECFEAFKQFIYS